LGTKKKKNGPKSPKKGLQIRHVSSDFMEKLGLLCSKCDLLLEKNVPVFSDGCPVFETKSALFS
jgi:hypothetical protein